MPEPTQTAFVQPVTRHMPRCFDCGWDGTPMMKGEAEAAAAAHLCPTDDGNGIDRLTAVVENHRRRPQTITLSCPSCGRWAYELPKAGCVIAVMRRVLAVTMGRPARTSQVADLAP